MKYLSIPGTSLHASNIIMGCMRISSLSVSELESLIKTNLELGINFFDHADIYGKGHCETLFGQAVDLHSSLRDSMIIQTKCGIRPGFFDFSKEHIINSVNQSLQRLNTDYLDVLLLHRPDTLMEPSEVAEAFTYLHQSGKVRFFGVSNQNSLQLELLQQYCPFKLCFNQLQFGLGHTPLVDAGLAANMTIDQSTQRTGEFLEYARLHEITIQAWSPYQYGYFEGLIFNNHQKYEKLNTLIQQLADQYQVSNTAIATAWITRHPANIQVIAGSTKPSRMKDVAAGSSLPLTREEWYRLYTAAGNMLP
ncbi:MAG: aldo/keto reductase family oxidoreductase [Lachnospiraceae bacterium]|jgi:predicted oxidoreductase|nr:aldo/keto reductase family oxidoreductase [Lachnospiraceae bacterium]